MNTDDTPRTAMAPKYLFSDAGQNQTLCVHVEFARELERENAKLRDQIAGLEAACDSLQQTVHALQNP